MSGAGVGRTGEDCVAIVGAIEGARGVLAACALLAAAGCGGDDDEGPAVVDTPILEVQARPSVPVCLLVEEPLEGEEETLPVIDCAEPHTHEVFDMVRGVEGDVYPGADQLGELARVECLRRFESFVGASVFDSSLSYTWIVPSLSSWNDDEEEDRDLLCVLVDPDDRMMIGSKRGSRA